MKVLIIGCGLVGKGLASHLREKGHSVVGTTTRESRIPELLMCCDEVEILVGHDRNRVHQVAIGCDAVVVCAGPSAQKAMTPEQRQQSYHEILVETAYSVASIPSSIPIIALSSLSVYGDAANHLAMIDESSPLSKDQDASPVCFQAAERVYMEQNDKKACVFRCPDITGADDMPIEEKVKMAHLYLQGSVPFHDDALFYRIDQKDVIAAIEFALEQQLVGIYNLVHQETPPSNQSFFNKICESLALPPLQFRNELKGPSQKISSAKILATGFEFPKV